MSRLLRQRRMNPRGFAPSNIDKKGDKDKMTTRNRYYNPNPLKKETSDCVVRALAKATRSEWDNVYEDLFKIGLELKVMPNDHEAWHEYLNRNGFVRHSLKVKKGQKRMRVNEFAKKHKQGTYVLRVANHIVACVDGYYYDTWDCGNSAVYSYFKLETDE